MTKYCKRCATEKLVSEFNKNSSKKDGLNGYCRDCSRKNSKKHYLLNRHTEKYKAIRFVNERAWRMRHPEKYSAQRKARRSKKQTIKAECENCGATEKLHRHHPDYSRPLYVITLCYICHKEEHNRLRFEAKTAKQ